jgi:hypothetical protein
VSFRLTLKKIALNRIEAIENLEAAMETIVMKMADCEFYASIYAESINAQLKSGQTTSAFDQNLESALPKFFAAVPIFLVKVKIHYSASTTGKHKR